MSDNDNTSVKRCSVMATVGSYDLWFRTNSFELLQGSATSMGGAVHMHTMYDIHWATKGSFFICFDGEMLRVTPGMIAIIPPNLEHCTKEDPNSPESCSRGNFKVSFIKSAVQPQEMSEDGKSFDQIVRIFSTISRPIMVADTFKGLKLFQTMYQEMNVQDFGYTQLLQATSVTIVALLARSIHHSGLSKEPLQERTSNIRQELIEEFFIIKIYDDVNPQELADILNISTRQLNRILIQIYGMSFRQKVASCRITKAKRLLLNTTCSLDEIAEQCGYSSASSLSRAFRSMEGCSPGEFRHRGLISVTD